MARATFRGKTFTDEDVRRAMERFDREKRSNFNRWRTYAIKYEGRDYPHLLADLSQLEPGLRLYNENGLLGNNLMRKQPVA